MTTQWIQPILLVLIIYASVSPAFAIRDSMGPEDKGQDYAASHHERMKEGIAERIQRAQDNYKIALQKKSSASEIALVSLSRRINVHELKDALRTCKCELLEIHRTVGETQMTFGSNNEAVADSLFEGKVSKDFIKQLKSSMTVIEADRRSFANEPASLRWVLQQQAAFSDALALTRQKGFLLNGFLIRADVENISTMQDKLGSLVLAIEFMQGSRRFFAIPLEVYR